MPSAFTNRPRLKAPAGTCDTAMHFYNDRYPSAPTALFTPPNAWIDEYVRMRERVGIERTIVVQPTVYGFDNRCTLDAVAALGSCARAIVVVDETVTDAELDRLTRAGARGVRFQMFPGGVLTWEIIETVAARIQPFGWHIQLQLDGRLLPEREALIRRLPGTLVIDHTGKFIEPVAVDDPAFRILLDLVGNGRTWVKLAAPYETSKIGRPFYDDVGALAKALVKAAPDRMLWASNWPHPSPTPRVPPIDEAELLDLLLDWAPDEATRRKILADNPARLYGF
jgi:D-galactarolactone isomerase